jgi:hypothetical protein
MINVHNNDFNVYKDNELQQHHEEKDKSTSTKEKIMKQLGQKSTSTVEKKFLPDRVS